MYKKAGISQLVTILSVVGVFIIGTISVYFFFDGNNSLYIPGLGTIGLSSRCKHNDADLCKFLNRAQKADYFDGSFAGSSTLTDSTGKIFKSTWEMNGKNASRVVNYEDSLEVFHMIIIGNTTFVKDIHDGIWWKQEQAAPSKEAAQAIDGYDFEQYKKQAVEDIRVKAEKSTYKKLGTDKCGQYTCFKYEVIDPQLPTPKEYIFFDTTYYILRKSRTEQTDGASSEMVYSYEKVSIKAPSPVKEAKPGQNIFFNDVSSSASEEELNYIKQFENNMKKSDQPAESFPNTSEVSPTQIIPTETILPTGLATPTPEIHQLQ